MPRGLVIAKAKSGAKCRQESGGSPVGGQGRASSTARARISGTATRTCRRRVFTVSHPHHARHGRRWHGQVADQCRGCTPLCTLGAAQQRPEQADARTVHPAHTRSSTRGRAGHPANPPHQLRVSGQFSACLTGEQNMGRGRVWCTR